MNKKEECFKIIYSSNQIKEYKNLEELIEDEENERNCHKKYIIDGYDYGWHKSYKELIEELADDMWYYYHVS